MMTKDEAAAAMNGCEYGREGSDELFDAMRVDGLVCLFGYSDDVVEARGAEDDEFGHAALFFNRSGLVRNYCDNERCPYAEEERLAAMKITADFGKDGWVFETNIPHATFDVMEDGELYGKGIVFALSELPA